MTSTNCGFIPGQHPLESAPANLHDLRRRLASLDATIAALTAERQKLQAESDAVVYPVLSLPTEITAAILLRCCDPGVTSRPDPAKGPLLVTQICGEWREVATHTPEIWRSLEFTEKNPVELFELWLARSANAPLNLSLYSWDPVRTGPFMAASILHAHHWQHVKFGLPLAAYLNLDLTSVSLPILRRISMDITHPPNEVVTGTVAVTNAPLLRHVYINAHPDVKVDLRWSQITTLTLHTIDLTKCISLLRECPDLVDLTILTTGEAHSSGSLVLQALEHLICSPNLLEHLTLPCLHRLNITNHVQPHVLDHFIRRSACPLHALSLTCHEMSVDTLIACLTAVPASVADFEVVSIIPAQLLAALTLPNLLPRLTTLRVRSARALSATYQDLIDALRVRLPVAPPRVALERFALDLTPSHSHAQFLNKASTVAQFRALAAAGLKIKLATRRQSTYDAAVFNSWTE
ncbi:hypothetical protein C8R46DRAFT_1364168 [Mycena filopes]|nr:hypothetical protein C8R46DRAFT_1364168 [Mycena filopes]